jgi:hypothetical protein
MHSERHARSDRWHGEHGGGANERGIYIVQTNEKTRSTSRRTGYRTPKTHHRKHADETQKAQTQPRGGNNAQESLHHADRGDIILVHPVDVIPRAEIDVAVNNPGLLSDARAVGLLRYEMRSASDAGRVDDIVRNA